MEMGMARYGSLTTHITSGAHIRPTRSLWRLTKPLLRPLGRLRLVRVILHTGRDLKVAGLRLSAGGQPFPKRGCAVQHHG